MTSFANAFAENVVAPVKAMRWRYLPLLMIYFASGASTFTAIAESFWVKERLSLSPEALVALAVWLQMPWTIKMVFGQLVDGVSLFGSRRRSYVFIGAALMACGYLLLAGTAGGWITFASAEALYVTASLLTVLGIVLQDVVADTMSTEVVDRVDDAGTPRDEADIDADLGMVQVLGRIAFMLGAFAVAGLGGWLADILGYEGTFLAALTIPAISITGSLLVRLDAVERKPPDRRILLGGLAFGAFTLAMGVATIPFAQEIIFVVSMVVIVWLLRLTVADVSRTTQRAIAYTAIVIFVFRAMPSLGPGGQWWQIDVLGFDPAFFGWLGQIGAGLAILGMWGFSDTITRKPVTSVLLWLTIVGTILSLPTLGLYYGLHEWTEHVFGFGARTIAIIDTSLASPFVQLSMIPMLTLIAIHAPPGRRATWFALMASLMNLALQAGGLFTKYLNMVFVVERGSYGELGDLIIAVTVIGLVVPLVTILLVGRRIQAHGTGGRPAPAKAGLKKAA